MENTNHKQWAIFDLHEYSANYEFAASLFKLTARTKRVGWELHPFQRFMSSALILSYPPNFAEAPPSAFAQKAVVFLNTLIISLIYIVHNIFFGNFFSTIVCSDKIYITFIINFKNKKFWFILLISSMLFNESIKISVIFKW